MRIHTAAVLALAIGLCVTTQGEPPSREEVSAALRCAVEFFRSSVATEGGYLWRYSADLSCREGEGNASATTVWVQPPGTPAVGFEMLDAYEATGDSFYLDAARETAHALVRGQLESGGWDYRIEFASADRAKYAYRVDAAKGDRNVTTLDDNTTQSALCFLMAADKALDFKDGVVHEAVMFGLAKLIEAQYPNGAWPQRFSAPPDPEKYPVQPASYPNEWPREWPNENYKDYYTFNDNTLSDMIRMFLVAYDVYGDESYRKTAERGGDFILLAQMPDPQPAWAQQYDHDMHPAWARKFEPPAVTGNESQGVMLTLLHLYDKTGQPRFLEPIPRAIAYLKASQLPGGRLARFYELKTNTPLYFTKDYHLTYSSEDMPTHYSFIGSSRVDAIEAEYKAAIAPESSAKIDGPQPVPRGVPEEGIVRRIIDAMDDRGAWVEAGTMRYVDDCASREVIDSATFATNVHALTRYLRMLSTAK